MSAKGFPRKQPVCGEQSSLGNWLSSAHRDTPRWILARAAFLGSHLLFKQRCLCSEQFRISFGELPPEPYTQTVMNLHHLKVGFISNDQGIHQPLWFKPRVNKIVKLDLAILVFRHRGQGQSIHPFMPQTRIWHLLEPDNFLVPGDAGMKNRPVRESQASPLLFSPINTYHTHLGITSHEHFADSQLYICAVLTPWATYFYLPLGIRLQLFAVTKHLSF